MYINDLHLQTLNIIITHVLKHYLQINTRMTNSQYIYNYHLHLLCRLFSFN